MKKVLVIKTMIFALCLGAMINKTYAQNDADPAITSMGFAHSPIFTPSHPSNPLLDTTTLLTVTFGNNGITTPIAAGSVGMNISLPPTIQYLALPQSVVALSGTFMSKFTWTYNSTSKNFSGVTNQAIAPSDFGTIIVKVVGNIVTTAPIYTVANLQRLNPAAYPNEDITNNSLFAALSVVPGSTTPITLLNFDAVKQGTTVLLTWKTSSELNSDHFDVEYSKDQSTWTSIGTVAAAGTSSTSRSYSLVHPNPVNGINYYRLKQVDIGGVYKYSEIRPVTFSIKAGITIKPNPVVDMLYITSGNATMLQSVNVYSAEGKLLQQISKFNTADHIDMSRYPAGTYLIRIADAQGNTETHTILKGRK